MSDDEKPQQQPATGPSADWGLPGIAFFFGSAYVLFFWQEPAMAAVRRLFPGQRGLVLAAVGCAGAICAQIIGSLWIGELRRPPEERRGPLRLLATSFGLGLPLAIAALGVTSAFWYNAVPNTGMGPTLEEGQQLTATPVSYIGGSPQRGDIVLARTGRTRRASTLALSSPSMQFASNGRVWSGFVLGRVVGLAGETIAIEKGQVKVNGNVLVEPYSSKAVALRDAGPIHLGPREYLVLQDERRPFRGATVAREDILGQVFQRYYPPTEFSFLEDLERSGGARGVLLGLGLVLACYLLLSRLSGAFEPGGTRRSFTPPPS